MRLEVRKEIFKGLLIWGGINVITGILILFLDDPFNKYTGYSNEPDPFYSVIGFSIIIIGFIMVYIAKKKGAFL